MTAYPHPSHFQGLDTDKVQAQSVVRPNVREHFWGYEVRLNDHTIGVAVLLRKICGFLTVSLVAAAVGIWMLPAASFAGDATTTKFIASVLLLCLAPVFGRMAARGARIRVQIDTSVGEFREVVRGLSGKVVVLARYGFDAVEAIDVVTSRTDETFGQVQVTFKSSGKQDHRIAVADGGAPLLGPLRSRLASDCGLQASGPARETEWTGYNVT